MAYENMLNPKLSETINNFLSGQTKQAFVEYSNNNDNLAQKMQNELDKRLERVAIIKKDTELSLVAESLVRIADQLDIIKKSSAISHVEYALLKLAEHCYKDVEYSEIEIDESPEDMIHVIQATLINISDKLDKRGYNDIANDVDKALGALSNKCSCGGSCCS